MAISDITKTTMSRPRPDHFSKSKQRSRPYNFLKKKKPRPQSCLHLTRRGCPFQMTTLNNQLEKNRKNWSAQGMLVNKVKKTRTLIKFIFFKARDCLKAQLWLKFYSNIRLDRLRVNLLQLLSIFCFHTIEVV